MIRTVAVSVALLLATALPPLSAQGVVVDQGRFRVSMGDGSSGTEDFVIRRAALGRSNAVFANGGVTLEGASGRIEVRPLLSVLPPEGIADAYTLQVSGSEQLELRLNKAQQRRYVARIVTPSGEEDREFPARADTRVVERGVAHHYYFLRDLREGRAARALEPRSRREITLTAVSRVDDQVTIRGTAMTARRVEFDDGEGGRTVWYDAQGRVLRVEVPAWGYVAVRTDVIG